jgi:maltose O-acetyltransferase
MTEKEKMLAGKIYDANDPELMALRLKGERLAMEYNQTLETDAEKRERILSELMPHADKRILLRGPVHFDYGCFIYIGEGTYANYNLTILDVCPVHIGKNVYFGTGVSLLTPMHPLIKEERVQYFDEKKGYWTDREYGRPITIGDGCWIASNVTVIGGVTIGEGSVIGAGSVVTHDIPPRSLAFGNPCKVRRQITEEDSIYKMKDLF